MKGVLYKVGVKVGIPTYVALETKIVLSTQYFPSFAGD